MSKKQLYIFVGTHKTGSTFLHKTLQGMAGRLLASGCHYDPRGVWLAKSLQGEGALPDQLSRARFRGEFDLASAQYPELNHLMISEQFMGSPNTGYVDCERIALGLRSVFHDFDVHLLLSFRRQDHFLESWYGQSIKEGGTLAFEDFLSRIPVEQLDWFRIANIYEKIFGKSSVRICRYDDLFHTQSDILNAHFQGWAYQGRLELTEPSVINPGLDASGLELFRLANEKYGHECRASLRTVFEANFARLPFAGSQLFSDTRRQELLDVFAQSNERLAQRYDLSPFASVTSDVSSATPVPEVKLTDSRSFELSVLEALSEINQLAHANHAKETSALLRKHAQEIAAFSRKHEICIKQLKEQTLADNEAQGGLKQQVEVLAESLNASAHEVKAVRGKLLQTESENKQLLESLDVERKRVSELESKLKKLAKTKSENEELLDSLELECKRVSKLVSMLKKLVEETINRNTTIADRRSAYLVKGSLRACTRKLESGLKAVILSEKKTITKKEVKISKPDKLPAMPSAEGRPSNPFTDKQSPEIKKWMGGLKRASKEEKDSLWRSYRQAVFKDSGEYAALMRLKDIHKGKRCFIIGNGPSLVDQDISLMANEVSFVSNWFVNSDRYSELMPKYYCVSSHEMFGGWNKPEPKLNQDFYERIQDRAKSSRKFFSFAFRDYMKSCGMFANEAVNYALFERPKEVVDLKGDLNLDLDKHLDDGYTVLLSMCIPLAVHMGCTEIYMVGCDCDYGIKKADDPKKYFYDPSLHTSSTTSFESLDRIWAEGGPVFTSYSIVHKKLESLGISFCNATKGGRLDVIPRVKYEDLFNA